MGRTIIIYGILLSFHVGAGLGEPTIFHANGERADGKVMRAGRSTTQPDGVTSDDKRLLASPIQTSLFAYTCCRTENLLAQSAAGVDVHFDAQGSCLEVSAPRMYCLAKHPSFGSHLPALEAEHADFILHRFTCGNNSQRDFEQN